MVKEYYSNGKLLISGEYVVLEGAKAFALPTKYGQSLKVKEKEGDCIHWTSYDVDGSIWMSEVVPLQDVLGTHEIEHQSEYYKTLVDVLRAAHRQNPSILVEGTGYEVVSELTFPRLWGLGTSSTWINNVAQWFNINPYQLLQESFGGSGYDIACARHDQGIFYTLTDVNHPEVEQVSFNPSFKEHLYFVYLNQKKSSKEAIANFKAKRHGIHHQVERISEISKAMSVSTTLEEFSQLMDEHEQIMSEVLGVTTVKQSLFADFDGSIKSLGGWGGDFVMVASKNDPLEYFSSKGYEVIVNFENMILF
ncbi:GHMP kinase [Myroides odoratimimus]|uniref:GHMP kinase n=1 Tax=Myroides odoratimimus TaxID=76832 RepID=A0AAI8C4R7_9FLAO|nr:MULTISPECIES: GYDIA family GHMP kinase [Myroides]ALU25980.1 GHMP kinase [Myroides odoratimimus]EHO14231.1 hypothetical protein HMPREF9714_00493 [Myroides odoratimimus CCUG 12901]EKB03883.1 hypothetical protein HMPREF9711_02068 [Myroides odoratimimus CCUG 3837]MCA4793962.1 GHMP kinase [Myroides odoratimimus]MCA4807162.1 GHMP kinase [Myroides odoratimimus]